MTMENINQIVTAIMPYVVTVVTALAGYVAVTIKNRISRKLDTAEKKEVAEATVNYIQQVYEALDGTEKMNKALETSLQWLSEKGIIVSSTEMRILLEAAIKGAKEGWASEKLAQNEVILQENAISQLNASEETNKEVEAE